MYELCGEETCYEELRDSIKSYLDSRKLPFLTSGSTFRISIETFVKALTFDEQKDQIHSLTYIPFEGRVNLKNPHHIFFLMEMDESEENNGLPPIFQRRIFFGREVGFADRKLLPTFQLKSRTYLDPTAMDAEMAFLMANQAKATSGKLVYDPFVGTWSILVSCCALWRNDNDIDIRVVHDQLHLAARMLVMKGRLVFFFLVLRDENGGGEVKFPEHLCFKLVAVSEQILSSRYSRVLLTMVKEEPYSEEIEEAARLIHLEFRKNHLKWLQGGNIRSSIFKPADSSQVHTDSKTFKDPKPKYRGKYV